MKKTLLALTGIVMLATTVFVYSCNKDSVEKVNTVAESQAISTKANDHYNPSLNGTPVSSNILRTNKLYSINGAPTHVNCGESGSNFCAVDINATSLTGEEACYLMREGYRYGMCMPLMFCSNNKAEELVDSATISGAITMYDDVVIKDKKLVELFGIDLFPADRYKASIVEYKGMKCVYIDFGENKM